MAGEKAALIAALLTAMSTTSKPSVAGHDDDDSNWHVGGADPTANAAIANVMREGRHKD